MTLPSLRPHQLRATQAAVRELRYRKGTLVCHSTGSGKTAIIGAMARLHLRRGGERVLLTAPRGELLRQGEKWIRMWMPRMSVSEIGYEQAAKKAHSGNRVVLASLDSLSEERLETMPPPDLWLVDEAHLMFDKVLALAKRWPDVPRVGFTATPDRLDQKRLLPHLFESTCDFYGVLEAIGDGYLVEPRFMRVLLEGLELPKVRGGDDYAARPLSAEMRKAANVRGVVDAALKLAAETPTLVFAVDLAHGRSLVDRIRESVPKGFVELVHGGMSHSLREHHLDRYRDGELPMLVSVALLTYGVDLPRCQALVIARPTRSRSLWCQMVGRALRPFEGKEDALVLDFVANTTDLSLIPPSSSLELDLELLEEREAEPFDSEEEKAVEEDLEEAEEDREDAGYLEDTFSPGYQVHAVDNQLSVVGIDVGLHDEGADDAKPWQVDRLKKLGLEDAHLLSFDQAKKAIEELVERWRAGYPSLRQSHELWKRGLDPNMKRDDAKWIIDKISGLGWPRSLPLALAIAVEKKGLTYTGRATLKARR